MVKIISLGEYNKEYKYIWIYLVIRFIFTFVFTYELIFAQFQIKLLNSLPSSPFISIQLDYLGYIIISTIIIIIKNHSQKRNRKNSSDIIKEKQLIFIQKDIAIEYGFNKGDYFLFINLLFVVLIDMFYEIVYKFNCFMFNY